MTQSNELNNIATRLESLLDDVKASMTEFASMKAELGMLHDHVKILSRIVREGNGEASLLTRMALLEQKLSIITKWQDDHFSTHKRSKEGTKEIHEEIDDIQKTILLMQKQVEAHDVRLTDDERAEQDAVNKELELAHEKKISEEKIKTEHQKLIIKVLVAVLVAAITFVAGYFMN